MKNQKQQRSGKFDKHTWKYKEDGGGGERVMGERAPEWRGLAGWEVHSNGHRTRKMIRVWSCFSTILKKEVPENKLKTGLVQLVCQYFGLFMFFTVQRVELVDPILIILEFFCDGRGLKTLWKIYMS